MRNRDKARITAANRDALRERCFALHAQGLSYAEIGARLNISKNTAMKYTHLELPRRRHDPEAQEVLDRATTSMRDMADLLRTRLTSIEGNGPQAANARLRTAKAIDRIERSLLYLHGIELPETDPERILQERGRKMDETARELYPELNEQAILERHLAEEERKFIERYGKHPLEKRPKPEPEEDYAGEYTSWEDMD